MPVPVSQMWTVASYVLKQKLARRERYPLVVMLEIFSVALPVLVSVTVCGELVCPIGTFLKFKAVADRETAGPPPPPQLVNTKDPMCELQLNEPFTFSY